MFETNIPAWQEQFGWFWFNYEEIYRFTDEQLEAKVKSYADMGITTLIGFSSTHFRFSFMPYKDKIHDCIRRIVVFCHKYNMRYVEHHSSALYYAPKSESDWKFVINHIVQKGDQVEDWIGLMDIIKGDPVVGGYHLSEMTQVEGSTGTFANRPYASYALCHNNPKYREVYFNYLEELYALGIDGIMNDEVQWIGFDSRGRNNACTCPYCRAQFKEQYGYELPQPEDWDDFCDDYSNPAFVAWKRFRLESHVQFVRDVNRHFKALGYEMMRPNYMSHILYGNPTAHPFEACADVWDFIFQENCTFSIISASFAEYALEAIHRNAMGAERGCPSMSMFYPYHESALYFSWALAKSWGQLYMQTSEDQLDADSLEAPYRAFEKEHFAFLDEPRRLADFAFLHSAMTRDYAADRIHTVRFRAALQGAYLSGFGTDLVFETAPLERLTAYRTIVCVSTAMLSDATLKTLAAYVKQGGTLAIIGDFAKYDDLGQARSDDTVKAFFGNWESLCAAGSIRLFPAESCCDKTQYEIVTDRYLRGSARSDSAPYVVEEQRKTTGQTLLSVVGRKRVECTAAEDILASAFETKAGIAVHLVNITDVLEKNGKTVAHYDPIKPFCKGAACCDAVTISLETKRNVSKATAYTMEHENTVELPLACADGRVCFTIPGDFFAGYCMIELS